MSTPYNEAIASDIIDVACQVVNYLEGFNQALTGEDLTVIRSKHYSLGYDAIERVFKTLNLDKLGYDHRYYYKKLWFDTKEIFRISDEVEPHIRNLTYQFHLKDHSPDPSKLDELFQELFEIIHLDEEDKNRFQASLSDIMSQVIGDILGLPSDRSRFALVLYGSQGSGKTTFNTVLCNVLIGKDVNLSKRSLYSGFDSEELLNPVIRVEDLDYDFRNCIDVMKTYITNITLATINVKYKPEKRVLIRTTPLMDTNNDFINIIKTDGEQRRFCIFKLNPPKTRQKFDEKRLYEVLDKIYKLHSHERYYNEKKLMRINRELSDPHKNFVEEIKNSILADYNMDGKVKKYTKTQLKELIKEVTSKYGQDFVSDSILFKVIQVLMKSEHNSHTKSNVYSIKDFYLNSKNNGKNDENNMRVIAGNCGVYEKPLKELSSQNFFITPASTRNDPQTFINQIPGMNLYTHEERLSLTLEKYAEDFRDFFIDNVIIENNKILFSDTLRQIPPEQLESCKEEPPEEVEDTREILNISNFRVVTPPKLFMAKVREALDNTKYPTPVTLTDLEIFKIIVQWDHVGNEFDGKIAKNDNFLSSNIFIIDIDSHKGEDLSKIDDMNKLGLEYYRVPSKSGKGFHFYFPLSHQIKEEAHYRIAYESLCRTIEREVHIVPDKACKNPSRKWLATSHHNRAIYNEGIKFDVLKALSEIYRIEGYETETVQSPPNPSKTEPPSKSNLSEPSRAKTLSHEVNEALSAWGIKESNVLLNPLDRDMEYDPPQVVSSNRALTDKYYHGELNKSQVHEDIKHMIMYLSFLKSKGFDFKSDIDKKKIPVDEVINRIKEVVSYDLGHLDYVYWILDKYEG